MSKYPQPHRKMYLAYKKGRGITLSADDLDRLFLMDDAMMTAATQHMAKWPWKIQTPAGLSQRRKTLKKGEM